MAGISGQNAMRAYGLKRPVLQAVDELIESADRRSLAGLEASDLGEAEY